MEERNVVKWLLITHRDCRDGLGCAMVFKHFVELNNVIENLNYIELDIHYANYGDSEIPDVTGKNVIIADFSYSRDIIEDMYDKAEELMVIDHHKTSKDILAGLSYAKFDMNKSGAVLSWEFLFSDHEVPKLLEYIQDRDLWNWALPNSKEVSAGFSVVNIDEALNNLDYYLSDECIDDLIVAGKSILKYQNSIVDRIVKNTDKMNLIDIKGYKVPCINNTTLISEVGNELTKTYPFSLQYFITEDLIIFSLRSDKNGQHGFVDVSEIAKSFGGGGHPEAAGFSIELSKFDFNTFYKEKRIAVVK